MEYMVDRRGIPMDVLTRMKIEERLEFLPQTGKEEACICFPYLEDGVMKNMKLPGIRNVQAVAGGCAACVATCYGAAMLHRGAVPCYGAAVHPSAVSAVPGLVVSVLFSTSRPRSTLWRNHNESISPIPLHG